MKAQKTIKTDEVTVVVDYRELKSQVCKELFELGIKLNPQPLEVADFQASERVGIERKTQEDFLQSIIDGRIFSQAIELSNSFSNPIIMLEGSEDIFSIRDIHENSIRGAISSILIDYKIPILRTYDEADTARYIAQIAKREQLELKREVQIRGDKRAFSLREWQEYIVASLPNVGLKLAQNLLRQLGSVQNVFTADEESLKKVEKIGEKKAKDIRKIVTEEYK